MAILTLYKNARQGTNVVLKDGSVIGFVKGRYFTTNEEHKAELDWMASKGEAGVFIDENEPTVDTEAVTPLEIERRKAVEEFKKKYGLVETSGRVEIGQPAQVLGADVSTEPGKVTAVPAATPVTATNPPPTATSLDAVLAAKKAADSKQASK